jgi:hypothetical protein
MLEWIFLNSKDEIPKKVIPGANVRMINCCNPSVSGELARCISKEKGVYTFAICVADPFTPKPNILTLSETEGQIYAPHGICSGRWMFDYPDEGKYRFAEELTDSDLKIYNPIIKDFETFMNRFKTKEEQWQFLLRGKYS